MRSNVLIRPLVTEKSMQDGASGRFTFVVDIDADKITIAKAAKEVFGVDTVAVKTITMKGQNKRAGRKRMEVAGQPWKKAVIELPKGQKIDLFDVTEEHKHAEKS